MQQRQWIYLFIGIAIAALIPAFLGTYWISLLLQILIYGLLALSVDLLIGHTGLVPLGHAAFFATAQAVKFTLLDAHLFAATQQQRVIDVSVRLGIA